MTNHLYDGLLRAGLAERERVFAFLPGDREISFGDLETRIARLANVLVENDVAPGDRVAMQAGKSIEALVLYLAAIRAGAVFLPLNTGYTPTEIAYFLGDAKPALFVCPPDREEALAPLAADAGARLFTLDEDGTGGTLAEHAAKAGTDFTTISRGPDDLAAILYTSGTTGRSKGAMLSHANLLSNAEVLRETWRFDADDVLLHVLPIFHTHGLFVATNTLLVAGGALLFLPRFDLDAVFAHLPKATSMMGVPTFYTRMLDDPRLTRDATAHMRVFTSGSAPLLAETHTAFEARTGQRILERYGMTETNMNTSNPYDGERRAGTVGFPLAGTELRIVSPDGDPLPDGEIGGIEVRGPNVFRGYWDMPEKTAQEFREDGFFMTGDLGRIDADGYVIIVGRDKDLVISGGYNVYPKEVEEVIDALPGVVESAVIGVPHPDFGEGVVAVVVAREALEEARVIAPLEESLARYKQPKRVVFTDELPRNTMGKVQKNILRKTYADLFA
ncbi:malonyl-CoA/methylmalonyl-CoA synthetase [Palleronia aestuarii]|uniref:Malonyl-CoA/methylmalonyl-CoA synthetase n=1 Tax=Palleronia aestuarii TaxID=568105 RepID=A0A2W7NE41_9RHOB|nr:malonyl-CoA synthase [Palleronia aestuarii]PZX18448.1 malonyl-CoA/methylmalonyl-CoA synthetase [Palleronia aestuarii]